MAPKLVEATLAGGPPQREKRGVACMAAPQVLGGHAGSATATGRAAITQQRQWQNEPRSVLCWISHLAQGGNTVSSTNKVASLEIGDVNGTPGAARPPVRAKVTCEDGPASEWFEPYGKDPKEWRIRLKQAFGTASWDFVETSMRQLLQLAKLPQQGVATSTSLSSALTLIISLAPEGEVQAALAVHIACLHMASLRILARMDHVSERRTVAMAAAAAKLEREFQSAITNYYRMKRGATQIVRIERVEVQSGAQAIVGVVRSK